MTTDNRTKVLKKYKLLTLDEVPNRVVFRYKKTWWKKISLHWAFSNFQETTRSYLDDSSAMSIDDRNCKNCCLILKKLSKNNIVNPAGYYKN